MCGAVCVLRPEAIDYDAKEVKSDKGKDFSFQGVVLGDLWQRVFSYADCPEIAGTNRFFRMQYAKRSRRIVQSVFAEEKIASLLPLFTSVFVPKAIAQASDHESLCLYYQMRVVYSRLERVQGEHKEFCDLVQEVYWRSLGILSQGEVKSKNPKERGALLGAMIAGGMSVPAREVIKLTGEEQIMCLPKEIAAFSLKILDVHSQGISTIVLEKMTVLTHLNLSANKLREISLQEKNVPALQMIDISHNPLKIFPEQLFLFKNLVTITIDTEQQKKFSEVLQQHKTDRKDVVIELIN